MSIRIKLTILVSIPAVIVDALGSVLVLTGTSGAITMTVGATLCLGVIWPTYLVSVWLFPETDEASGTVGE